MLTHNRKPEIVHFSIVFFARCVRLHTYYESSSLAYTHRSLLEDFLIEGDTSAHFNYRNLFLPINKLHKLVFLSRETCYQVNLLQFAVWLGIEKAIYVNFKLTKSFFGVALNVHGSFVR